MDREPIETSNLFSIHGIVLNHCLLTNYLLSLIILPVLSKCPTRLAVVSFTNQAHRCVENNNERVCDSPSGSDRRGTVNTAGTYQPRRA